MKAMYNLLLGTVLLSCAQPSNDVATENTTTGVATCDDWLGEGRWFKNGDRNHLTITVTKQGGTYLVKVGGIDTYTATCEEKGLMVSTSLGQQLMQIVEESGQRSTFFQGDRYIYLPPEKAMQDNGPADGEYEGDADYFGDEAITSNASKVRAQAVTDSIVALLRADSIRAARAALSRDEGIISGDVDGFLGSWWGGGMCTWIERQNGRILVSFYRNCDKQTAIRTNLRFVSRGKTLVNDEIGATLWQEGKGLALSTGNPAKISYLTGVRVFSPSP